MRALTMKPDCSSGCRAIATTATRGCKEGAHPPPCHVQHYDHLDSTYTDQISCFSEQTNPTDDLTIFRSQKRSY